VIAAERKPEMPVPAKLPSAVTERFAADLAAKSFELPLLPDVATQILAAVRDPNADLRTLADLVRRDAALTSHVLRLANSALYSPTVRIGSLQQAVSRLGLKALFEIAVVISCQTRVFSVPRYAERVRGIFRRCLASAFFAQEIARQRRWNVEEAFLCGLLHEVGRPLILSRMVELHTACGAPISDEAVDAAADAYHAKVAGDALSAWALPAKVAETASMHHDQLADGTAPTKEVAMVQVAGALAQLALEHPIVEHKAPSAAAVAAELALRAHPALAQLNLYVEEVDRLLARRTSIREAVEGVS